MKKSVCLMAILGALGATSAFATTQSVEVNFTGQVIEHSCNVSLANGQGALNLGSIKKDAGNGTKGQVVPLILSMKDCGANVNQVSKFELLHDLSVTHWGNTNITTGTLSTSQKGLVVQFYEDMSGAKEKAPSLVGHSVSGKTATVLGGYAALKRIGADTLTAGEVTAKGMFALTYN